MKPRTKVIVGVAGGVALLLYLRSRQSSPAASPVAVLSSNIGAAINQIVRPGATRLAGIGDYIEETGGYRRGV